MRRIILFFVFLLTSCSLFELDNYKAPSETLKGRVVDVKTGEPVLTDQGAEGIRVRLTETSWKGNVTPLDFNCMPDGTFQNTKLFEADYNVRIDGPFIPLIKTAEDGTVISNDTQDIHLKGVKELTFEVKPFLKVEFNGVPTVSDGVITARVVVTRATSREEMLAELKNTGYTDSQANITDIQLFVSQSSSVGYRARDTRWSSEIKYTGKAFEDNISKPIVIKSNGTIPSGRKVFIRAAARINYDTPVGSGTRRWNYSEPLEIDIP